MVVYEANVIGEVYRGVKEDDGTTLKVYEIDIG